MAFYDNVANFIKKFEGYSSKPYWDVNAYRLGYGSDTITLPDGTFRKVVKTDVTTREMAEKDIARRIKQDFEPVVKRQIGDAYNKLPEPARTALLSIAYNYGSITKPAIRESAKTGDVNKLADAIVTSTYNDNKKLPPKQQELLRGRRKEEADYAKSTFTQVTEAINEGVQKGVDTIKEHPAITIGITVAVMVALFIIYKTLIKKK